MRFNTFGNLSAQVASGGTFTAAYPSGTSRGVLFGGVFHSLAVAKNVYEAPIDFTVALGASNITVTNNSGATWPSGSEYVLSLDAPGERKIGDENGKFQVNRSTAANAVLVNLGSPVAASANGISASQSVASGANALLNGALAVAGVVTLDVPRNVVAAWTGAAVLTVNGEDEYGNAMVEASASGTTFTGKKAFKRVTSASFGAAVTAATIGIGDVLGLPLFLSNGATILKELQDGAAATAGTAVAGDVNKPTATTGDVRGTYDPNAAADGSKAFQLVVLTADPTYRGAPQFGG